MSERKPLRVAMIGTAFMGRAHSQAWHTAPRFFDLALEPVPAVIVGTSAKRTEEQARMLGWAEASTDWRAVVERDDMTSSISARPGTLMRRSRSPHSNLGSTCFAKSHWLTR